MFEFGPQFHMTPTCMCNPFGMGFTAANPKINFCLGIAASTIGTPSNSPSPMNSGMLMTNSIFGAAPTSSFGFNPLWGFNFNSFGGFGSFGMFQPQISQFDFSNYFKFDLSNFNNNSNNNLSNFTWPDTNFNFKYTPTNNNISSSSGDLTISHSSNSKIKPGLLKGNLVGKEDVIVSLCQKYNVDVGLVLTIIGQESSFGTSPLAQHNNFMGYRAAGDLGKNEKGFGYFSTPEKGLEKAIANLSTYPDRYKNVKKADLSNIDAIGEIYCEGSGYSSAIKNLYNTTVKKYLV